MEYGNLLVILVTIFSIVVYVLSNIVIAQIKKRLSKGIKNKRFRANIEFFARLIRYVLFFFLLFIILSSYAGTWTSLGIGVGLLSAALGWSLQRPITGIAGWIMVIIKRPFEIGDRIIIGDVKGDVVDITLNHIYIAEVGGITGGEENSGRITLVPNSKLFEANIINYKSQDQFVLNQIIFTITFESDLDKAIKIGQSAADKVTQDIEKRPYIQTFIQPNGVNILVRFFAAPVLTQEFSSRITQEVLREVKKSKDITLAYPHTEVILNKKKA